MTTYALVDHASHNVLIEDGSRAAVEALYERLVAADARARGDLEIVEHEDGPAPEESATVVVAR